MLSILPLAILLTWKAVLINSFAENAFNPRYNGKEFILCRKCGADVANSHYIFSKSSPGAMTVTKQSLFGQDNVTISTLVNPFGIKFDVMTIYKANCRNEGPLQGADSWFPGYMWRICTCPHCGHHLGWTFEYTRASTDDSDTNKLEDHVHQFHGLILGNILGENFTDSLIVMPKMYAI